MSPRGNWRMDASPFQIARATLRCVALIGRARRRAPVALQMALARAIGPCATSPTPKIGLDPQGYRQHLGLPANYPMGAPN